MEIVWKKENLVDYIKEHFPDAPIISIADIQRKFQEICIFTETENWKKEMEMMMRDFLSRINEWYDHEWTIFWLIRLIKDWIEMDIVNAYYMYISCSLNTQLGDLCKYIEEKSKAKDDFQATPKLQKLSEYYLMLNNYIESLVKQEIIRVKEQLWMSEGKTQEAEKNTRKKIFWIF